MSRLPNPFGQCRSNKVWFFPNFKNIYDKRNATEYGHGLNKHEITDVNQRVDSIKLM